MKYLASLLLFVILLAACKNTSVDQVNAGQAHDHGAVAILLFDGDMELFAEADQLFAGHGVEIRAHLTFLKDYSPAKEGILYARMVQGESVPDWEPMELAQAGIFTGTVIPEEPGTCDFQFMYEEDGLEVIFVKESMKVYSHDDELPPDPVHADEAIFTKEQAWKTEFGLLEIEEQGFKSSIHCSGEIIIAPSSRLEVISPASGKLSFHSSDLIQGKYVRKGDILFTILGNGFSHDNIILELNTARAEYEKSKANMERKEKLVEIEAVSKKEYELAKSVFEQDKARYDILKSQVSESGMIVKSPISGFISSVRGSDNSFVENGTVLLEMLKEDGVLIKANVPSSESNKLGSVNSANIKFPQDPQVYSISDFGGKVLNFGHEVESQSGMIPLYLSLDKKDIIAGTFIELWLVAKVKENQIVIPTSSLLEEYGQYYVYVQDEGEAYIKRLVKIAESDGMNYRVTSGLEPGEVIISKGGMSVKIANAMGAPPVHSH